MEECSATMSTKLVTIALFHVLVVYSTSLAMATDQPATTYALLRATVVLTGKDGASGSLFFAQQANGATLLISQYMNIFLTLIFILGRFNSLFC